MTPKDNKYLSQSLGNGELLWDPLLKQWFLIFVLLVAKLFFKILYGPQ